jgi:hypothetical protein
MYQIGEKAIYYDGTHLTFKRVICTTKGLVYYFNELPYGLTDEEFKLTSLPIVGTRRKILARQSMV